MMSARAAGRVITLAEVLAASHFPGPAAAAAAAADMDGWRWVEAGAW